MNATTRSSAAAALLIVPVVAELASEPFGDTTGFKLAFAASQVVGWMLLAGLCQELSEIHPPANRTGRVAARLLVVGCTIEMMFGLLYGVLELATGEPELSFILFSLGFLLLVVAGLLRGTQLRKAGAGIVGGGLVATALLGFLAIAIGSDPFHDIFLLTGYAAWGVVGLGIARTRQAEHGDLAPQSV